MADHYKTMNNADWGSPSLIVEPARAFQGAIDLDPCSSAERNQVVKARVWLGIGHADPEIGIPVEWGNARHVFINPPGGKFGKISLASIFWQAAAAHVEETDFGSLVWVAYNVNQLQTLQQANADLLRACCVCVPDKRVQYLDTEGVAQRDTPSASAILGFAWGERANEQNYHWTARFARAFSRVGAVWQPVC